MRLGLIVLALAIAAPASVSAWCRMTTSRRAPTLDEPCIYPDAGTSPPERYLAWTRRCTSLALSSDARSADMSETEVREVLARSVATWNAVECGGARLDLEIHPLSELATCTGPLYRDGGANANTVLFIAAWDREYDPAAYAVTTVWHRRSTGEILDADVEINERRGPFGTCPETDCTDGRVVDLENVLTHELGHYFGLAHTTDPDATMYYSAVAGEVDKRSLEADDIAGLCAIYPPGSLPTTCDDEPTGGLRLDCNTGCSIRPDRANATLPFTTTISIAFAIAALVRRRQRSSSSARRATS